jgi:hypothetical protein
MRFARLNRFLMSFREFMIAKDIQPKRANPWLADVRDLSVDQVVPCAIGIVNLGPPTAMPNDCARLGVFAQEDNDEGHRSTEVEVRRRRQGRLQARVGQAGQEGAGL